MARAWCLLTVAATVARVTLAAHNTVTFPMATTIVRAYLNAAVLARVARLTVAHSVVN